MTSHLRRTLAVVCTTLGAASPCHAQSARWMPIYADRSVTMTVDTTTFVERGDGAWTVWTTWTYATSKPLSVSSKRKFNSIRSRTVFDCSAKRFKDLETLWYDGEGNVVKSTDAVSDVDGNWETPIPDTYGEAQLSGFCMNQRRASPAFREELANTFKAWDDAEAMRDSACVQPPGDLKRWCSTLKRVRAIPSSRRSSKQISAYAQASDSMDAYLHILEPHLPDVCLAPAKLITVAGVSFCY